MVAGSAQHPLGFCFIAVKVVKDGVTPARLPPLGALAPYARFASGGIVVKWKASSRSPVSGGGSGDVSSPELRILLNHVVR